VSIKPGAPIQAAIEGLGQSRPLLFAVVGAANTLVDWIIFTVLVSFAGWAVVPANVVSFLSGAVQSYVLNSAVTFRAPDARRNHWRAMAWFAAVTAVCVVLSTAIVHVLAPTLSPWGAKLVATLATFTVGYLLHKRITFRDQRLGE
jgi:putative flippase GtrA